MAKIVLLRRTATTHGITSGDCVFATRHKYQVTSDDGKSITYSAQFGTPGTGEISASDVPKGNAKVLVAVRPKLTDETQDISTANIATDYGSTNKTTWKIISTASVTIGDGVTPGTTTKITGFSGGAPADWSFAEPFLSIDLIENIDYSAFYATMLIVKGITLTAGSLVEIGD